MKLIACMVAWLLIGAHAQARETRREVMDACAQQAQIKRLAGDEHSVFMRECLRPVDGYKPPAVVKADPHPVIDLKGLTEPEPPASAKGVGKKTR